nr:hypothetical protein [Clavibacter michiganensis]
MPGDLEAGIHLVRHVERAVQHLVADVTRVGAALLRDGVHEADTAARLRRLLGARAGERIGGGRAVEGHDDAVAEPEVGGGHDHERAGHEGGELHAAHPVEAAAGVAGLVGSDDEHVVRAHRGGERGGDGARDQPGGDDEARVGVRDAGRSRGEEGAEVVRALLGVGRAHRARVVVDDPDQLHLAGGADRPSHGPAERRDARGGSVVAHRAPGRDPCRGGGHADALDVRPGCHRLVHRGPPPPSGC